MAGFVLAVQNFGDGWKSLQDRGRKLRRYVSVFFKQVYTLEHMLVVHVSFLMHFLKNDCQLVFSPNFLCVV